MVSYSISWAFSINWKKRSPEKATSQRHRQGTSACWKHLFKAKKETKAPAYLALVTRNFNDKDVDNLIEHFRDKERRKELFAEYKEIEMLYEIISPDAFLRPFIGDFTTLSSVYAVVRNAYTRTVYVDKAFQKKTNELVQKTCWGFDDCRTICRNLSRPTKRPLIRSDSAMKEKPRGSSTLLNPLRNGRGEQRRPISCRSGGTGQVVQEGFEDRQTTTAETSPTC